MGLGRGLASLISGGRDADAEDVLEQIDSMEVTEEAVEEEITVATKSPLGRSTKTVDVVEDFDELDEMEELAPPVKPLVTPLSIDPESGQLLSDPSAEAKSVEVADDTQDDEILEAADDDGLFAVEDEETEVVAEVIEEEEDSVDEPEELPAPAPQTDPEPVEVEEEEIAPVEEPPVAKRAPVAAAQQVEMEDEEVITPSFGEAEAGLWDKHEDQVQHVPLGDIKINPLQPRRSFDPQELAELKDSIAMHGILQPLVVRRLSGNQGYELIAGERRLRAARDLKWDKVPAVVRRDVKSDQSRLVFALIENIQRENLNAIEEALAYQRLNEEYGLTHEEIGERVGKSRVSVTNIVRVLQLPAEVQRGLAEGKITMGHAKAILMIPDEEKQIRFYRHLVDEGVTVRKAEIRARRIQRAMKVTDPARRKNRGRHPLALKYAPALEERFGYDANVTFLQDKNRYEVVFRAYNDGEIDELVNRLLGRSDLPVDQDKDVIDD